MSQFNCYNIVVNIAIDNNGLPVRHGLNYQISHVFNIIFALNKRYRNRVKRGRNTACRESVADNCTFIFNKGEFFPTLRLFTPCDVVTLQKLRDCN